MLKQSMNRMKKVLTILLTVFLVASLTVGAASACSASHGHHNIHGHNHFSSATSHSCSSTAGHSCNSCKTGACKTSACKTSACKTGKTCGSTTSCKSCSN